MSQTNIDTPSPQKVFNAEVTVLYWEFLRGGELIGKTEVWLEGKLIAKGEKSIGPVGTKGDSA